MSDPSRTAATPTPPPAGSSAATPASGTGTAPAQGPGLARIAVLAALIAVLGLTPAFPLPGLAVPLTLQTLGVMLAGVLLGPWRGAACIVLFHLLVAVGLPLLAGGRGGLGVYVGPTVGYFVGWLPGVIVAGLVFHSLTRTRGTAPRRRPAALALAAFAASVVGGIVAVYAVGIAGLSLVTGMPLGTAALGSLAFLPGDLVKAALVAALTAGLATAYPRALA